MSNDIAPLSPVTVSTLIATDIQATALNTIPPREQLAEVISEVQIQTQTLGASLLHIHVIDPGWAIQRTGWLNVSSDGLLDEIEVEFPNGSNMWWRLALVEGGNDLTQPNLTLTFQDRIVSYLQDKWGPIGVAPNTTTRAQFIKQLVDQVGQGDGLQPIRFVCPEINQIQVVATTQLALDGTTTVNSAVTRQRQQIKINKLPGITNTSLLTTDQLTFTLQLASQTNLDPAVIATWVYAEQNGSAALARQTANNQNWLDIGYFDSGPGQIAFNAAFNSPVTAANQTALFLKGQWGGASQSIQAILGAANSSPTNQLAAIYNSNWASSKYGPVNAQGQPLAPGQYLIADYKQITGVPAPGTTTGLPAVSAPSDVSQLTRGTADNPDETSWECMQRLASEVNWYLFSNGDTLYFMDGVQFQAQPPAVTLVLDDSGTTWTAINPPDGDTATDVVSNLTYTFDQTAFQYQATHKRKGRVQRKTGVRTPQTPSQIKLNMICGVLDYRAGDVFVFRNSGIIDGRWIVEDATRNCLADRHTQFTLGPPILPNLEPAATAAGSALSGSTPKTTVVAPVTQPGTTGNARTPSDQSKPGAGLWYPAAHRLYTPKLDHGPRTSTSGIVVHVNAGGTYASVVQGFEAGGFVPGVGAHFEIGSQSDGPPVQFLPLDRVAWHAGNANGFSVGIEHAGQGASRQEWVGGHGNMLTTSANLAAWILSVCNLGAPVINTNNPSPVRPDGSPAGNIWPHNLGRLVPGNANAWGGHTCPDGPDGVDHFPWDVWGLMVAKAYAQIGAGTSKPIPPPAKPTAATPALPSLWSHEGFR